MTDILLVISGFLLIGVGMFLTVYVFTRDDLIEAAYMFPSLLSIAAGAFFLMGGFPS